MDDTDIFTTLHGTGKKVEKKTRSIYHTQNIDSSKHDAFII